MKNWRRISLCGVALTTVAIGVLVGCNFLQYQFCIFNGTPYVLREVNIVVAGDTSWGPNDLADGVALDPGASQDIKGFSPGTYWVRAVFDVVDPCGNDFCDTDKSFQLIDCQENTVFVYNIDDLPSITTTNLCLDYSVRNTPSKGGCENEIYSNPHFEI